MMEAVPTPTPAPASTSTSASSSSVVESKDAPPIQPAPGADVPTDPRVTQLILTYLRKRGFTASEEMLRRETKQTSMGDKEIHDLAMDLGIDVHTNVIRTLLTHTPREETPEWYSEHYERLRSWIYACLDPYRDEMIPILWPIYVHIFLELIKKGFPHDAHRFFATHKIDHVKDHVVEITSLSRIVTDSDIQINEYAPRYLARHYDIALSAIAYQLLINFIEEQHSMIILKIINSYINIRVVSERPLRNDLLYDYHTFLHRLHPSKQERDRAREHAQQQASIVDMHRHTIQWGTLRELSELQLQAQKEATQRYKQIRRQQYKFKKMDEIKKNGGVIPEDDEMDIDELLADADKKDEDEKEEEGEDGEKKKSKTKKPKPKTTAQKEAEEIDREAEKAAVEQVPVAEEVMESKFSLPTMSDDVKTKYIKDLQYRVRLTSTSLPSIAFYTFLNASNLVNDININHDGSMVATCCNDSSVRVWDVTQSGATTTQPPTATTTSTSTTLSTLTPSTSFTTTTRTTTPAYSRLIGHTSAVYASSFSPDNAYLLTASRDASVRLWSMENRTNLVAYKGHNYPVWDVAFSPLGFYFATASHDRTARLWSTDRIYPLRIFAGHTDDVDVVTFHPNCNYVATGSSDETVRLWDIQSGECVRLLTGHTATVRSLAMSPDGKYLASGGDDGMIRIWDLSQGRCLRSYTHHDHIKHTRSITCLDWSGEGQIVASGSDDHTVRLWNPHTKHETDKACETYHTKQTPVSFLRFTPRNLLLGAGIFRA